VFGIWLYLTSRRGGIATTSSGGGERRVADCGGGGRGSEPPLTSVATSSNRTACNTGSAALCPAAKPKKIEKCLAVWLLGSAPRPLSWCGVVSPGSTWGQLSVAAWAWAIFLPFLARRGANSLSRRRPGRSSCPSWLDVRPTVRSGVGVGDLLALSASTCAQLSAAAWAWAIFLPLLARRAPNYPQRRGRGRSSCPSWLDVRPTIRSGVGVGDLLALSASTCAQLPTTAWAWAIFLPRLYHKGVGSSSTAAWRWYSTAKATTRRRTTFTTRSAALCLTAKPKK